jgi:glycosyltransferase involved in cell wall biosynthesis
MKVLQIGCDNFGKGGRSMLIYSLCLQLHKTIQFDFLCTNESIDPMYEKRIQSWNGQLLFLPKFHGNYIKKEVQRFLFLRKLIAKDQCDIVHVNADDAWEAFKSVCAAKKAGVKRIIVHAHNTGTKTKSKIKQLLIRICQVYIHRNASIKLACSYQAAEYLYGRKYAKKCQILNNGIDACNYLYCENDRIKIRNLYHVQKSEKLIGTIARLEEQKNPYFYLEFIYQIKKQGIPVKGIWIGDGSLKDSFFKKIKTLGLEENIIWIQQTNSVSAFLSAMDLFVLPSVYEGFGLVNLEAQANGLSGLVSTAIPENVIINENFLRLDLNEGVSSWVKAAQKLNYARKLNQNLEEFRSKGFILQENAKILEEIYFKLSNENKHKE